MIIVGAGAAGNSLEHPAHLRSYDVVVIEPNRERSERYVGAGEVTRLSSGFTAACQCWDDAALLCHHKH